MPVEISLKKVFFFLLGIVLIILGWQGRLGSGLAALLVPGALEEGQ